MLWSQYLFTILKSFPTGSDHNNIRQSAGELREEALITSHAAVWLIGSITLKWAVMLTQDDKTCGVKVGGLNHPLSPPIVHHSRLRHIMTGNDGSHTDWWVIPAEGNTSLVSSEGNPALWDKDEHIQHRWKEMCFHLPVMLLFSMLSNWDYAPHTRVLSWALISLY